MGRIGGAVVNAGDFLEAFEGAVVDRTAQAVYRKHAVLLVGYCTLVIRLQAAARRSGPQQ
jgi:hypothetical protein